MKGLTALGSLLLASGLASAASIDLNGVYPSDIQGNPIQVQLGESFYLTAKLSVAGELAGPYRIRYDLPYASRTSVDVDFGGAATVAWGPFLALTDRIEVRASVLSDRDKAGAPAIAVINSKLPSAGLEYFNPQRLSGNVGAVANLSSGTTVGLQWFAPIPMTGGFQDVAYATFPGSASLSQPYAQRTAAVAKTGSVNVNFEATVRSSRVNSNILKSVGFSAYKSLPANVSVWLNPETLIQSRSADVANFVSSKLPKNYKTTMTPFAAAQTMFQAVVNRVQYVEGCIKPDAVTALKTGKGDCGYFSALFVATCRNMGIPARTVCGMTLGTGEWHVWAEFYIPGQGWIPVDPSYADALCPDGSQPIYYGTIPDLNERVALTYGFDHTVSGRKFQMLQSPAVVFSGGTRVASVQPYCSLQAAGITP